MTTLDISIKNELNRNQVTESIKREFENNNISLSQNTSISTLVSGSEWLINDVGNMQVYLIKLEDGKLNIYKVQQAETRLVITTMEQ